MIFRLINSPRRYRAGEYERSLEAAIAVLFEDKGVRSVYQIGGVSNPGISDLDLVVVFRDGHRSIVDPLSQISHNLSYPFTHSLFAVCESHFQNLAKYEFFHTFRHLAGEEQPGVIALTPKQEDVLGRQVGLEYLVSNMIGRSVERCLGVLNVRSILLSAKAVSMDLRMIGFEHQPMMKAIKRLEELRDNWFALSNPQGAFRAWFEGYSVIMWNCTEAALASRRLYTSAAADFQYARHISLVYGKQLSVRRSGTKIPPIFDYVGPGGWTRKVNSRTARFEFAIPWEQAPKDGIAFDRFCFLADMISYCVNHYRFFRPLANTLVLRMFDPSTSAMSPRFFARFRS